jgi:hypothetical protein
MDVKLTTAPSSKETPFKFSTEKVSSGSIGGLVSVGSSFEQEIKNTKNNKTDNILLKYKVIINKFKLGC